MRSGIYDVLPTNSLESLTAEDMRLLLCGCQQVDTDTLKKITIFSDESSKYFITVQYSALLRSSVYSLFSFTSRGSQQRKNCIIGM